jgi:hypothetical protein
LQPARIESDIRPWTPERTLLWADATVCKAEMVSPMSHRQVKGQVKARPFCQSSQYKLASTTCFIGRKPTSPVFAGVPASTRPPPEGDRHSAPERPPTRCHARGASGINSLILIYTSRIPKGFMNRPFMPLRRLAPGTLFRFSFKRTFPEDSWGFWCHSSTTIILCATAQAFLTLIASALFGQTFDSIFDCPHPRCTPS